MSIAAHTAEIYQSITSGSIPKIDKSLVSSYTISYNPLNSNGNVTDEAAQIIQALFAVINSSEFYKINDSELLIQLLSSILLQLSVSQVSDLFNLADTDFVTVMSLCLDPEHSHILVQKIAIELLCNSTLEELLSIEQSIVSRIFQLFASDSIELSVVSSIDKFFDHIIATTQKDRSVFYKVFILPNIQSLFAMKSFRNQSSVISVRLLDLLIKMYCELPLVVLENRTLFMNLYLYPPSEFTDDDVFYFNKLINLYTAIFTERYIENSEGNDIAQYLLESFSPQLNVIFRSYSSDNVFSKMEMFQFFGALSNFSINTFTELNDKYRIMTSQSFKYLKEVELLALVNPDFFVAANYSFEEFRLTEKSLPVLLNLISSQEAFNKIAYILTPKTILRNLSDSNVVILISRLCDYDYATEFLIKNLHPLVYENIFVTNITPDMIQSNFQLNNMKVDLLNKLEYNKIVLQKAPELAEKVRYFKAKIVNGDVYCTNIQTTVSTSTG